MKTKLLTVLGFLFGILGTLTTPLSAAPQTTTTFVGDIPVIECYDTDRREKMPLIILSHGFTRDKTMFVSEAGVKSLMENLVRDGFFVVSMDNRAHGERVGPRFSDRVRKSFFLLDVLEVRRLIKESADDVSVLIDHYAALPIIDKSRIGVSGISMGGFVSIRAASVDQRIAVAAPMIGSTTWEDLPETDFPIFVDRGEEALARLRTYSKQYSPDHQFGRLAEIDILFQNGGKDKHVHIGPLEKAFQEIKIVNPKAKLIVYPDLGHTVNQPMLDNVLTFFKETLLSKLDT